jgi:hypothetical protein
MVVSWSEVDDDKVQLIALANDLVIPVSFESDLLTHFLNISSHFLFIVFTFLGRKGSIMRFMSLRFLHIVIPKELIQSIAYAIKFGEFAVIISRRFLVSILTRKLDLLGRLFCGFLLRSKESVKRVGQTLNLLDPAAFNFPEMEDCAIGGGNLELDPIKLIRIPDLRKCR